MTLTELILALQALSRDDKLRLIQFLVAEIVREEGVSLISQGKAYPVWTPLNAFKAGDILLKSLKTDES